MKLFILIPGFPLRQHYPQEITKGLTQILTEREILATDYANIIKLPLIGENMVVFKTLRLKIRDNRTKGIEPWHKVNKEFYLRAGQFIDAYKRKETAENFRMEDMLLNAENHFVNIEKEKAEKLFNNRHTELLKWVEDESVIPESLGAMSEDIWANYLTGIKAAHKERKETAERVEKERIEAERKDALLIDRMKDMAPYYNFYDGKSVTLETTEEEYQNIKSIAIQTKADHEKKQAAIAAENERLRKEAAEKERLAKIEAAKQAKIEADRLAKEQKEKEEREKAEAIRLAKQEAERKAYEAKLAREREERAKAEAELKDKQEAERKANEAKLKKEREAKEAAEAELKETQAIEEKRIEDIEYAKQAALSASDIDKMQDLVNDLTRLKNEYKFKAAKNIKKYAEVGLFLDKIIKHIA